MGDLRRPHTRTSLVNRASVVNASVAIAWAATANRVLVSFPWPTNNHLVVVSVLSAVAVSVPSRAVVLQMIAMTDI